jgi:hypothetical protein
VSNNEQQKPSWLTLGIVTIAVGVTSGLGGMALGLLLRVVQHIAFGYSLHKIVGGESILQGVTAASDLRRFLTLFGCSVVTEEDDHVDNVNDSRVYCIAPQLMATWMATIGMIPR